MDFFVSIENTPYFHWQTELLIESFKMHGMEDNLVIAIAENDEPNYANFTKNLLSHERKFFLPNFGKHLNRFRSMMAALENDFISLPFTLIHPDMVLVKPFDLPKDCSVLFSSELFDPIIAERIEPHIQGVIKQTGFERDFVPGIIPLGDVLCFANVKEDFLNQMLTRTSELLEKHGEDWNVAKAGITLAMYDFLNLNRGYTYRPEPLESSLLHEEVANFIHYKHGLPPAFSKLHYAYETPLTFAADPFHMLLENNPTENTGYMQKVVRAYQGMCL